MVVGEFVEFFRTNRIFAVVTCGVIFDHEVAGSGVDPRVFELGCQRGRWWRPNSLLRFGAAGREVQFRPRALHGKSRQFCCLAHGFVRHGIVSIPAKDTKKKLLIWLLNLESRKSLNLIDLILIYYNRIVWNELDVHVLHRNCSDVSLVLSTSRYQSIASIGWWVQNTLLMKMTCIWSFLSFGRSNVDLSMPDFLGDGISQSLQFTSDKTQQLLRWVTLAESRRKERRCQSFGANEKTGEWLYPSAINNCYSITLTDSDRAICLITNVDWSRFHFHYLTWDGETIDQFRKPTAMVIYQFCSFIGLISQRYLRLLLDLMGMGYLYSRHLSQTFVICLLEQ